MKWRVQLDVIVDDEDGVEGALAATTMLVRDLANYYEVWTNPPRKEDWSCEELGADGIKFTCVVTQVKE
jgi:hypothetical protein